MAFVKNYQIHYNDDIELSALQHLRTWMVRRDQVNTVSAHTGMASVMTYNFDPDRWYENERRLLEKHVREGTLGAQDFQKAIEALDQRYDEMVKRLDGTYQIPPSQP